VSSALAARPSTDSNDCVASFSEVRQVSQGRNNPPVSPGPDSATDLDDSDGGLDELNATSPTRHEGFPSFFRLHSSSFSLARSLGTVPSFLFSPYSSDSLHEHIRERAPPSAKALAKADPSLA
jgi:hypothetical protein